MSKPGALIWDCNASPLLRQGVGAELTPCLYGITMLRIDIVNDGTGTHEIGNYRYYVYVTDTSGNLLEIARGEVKEHQRRWSWWVLAKHVADDGCKQWNDELNRMIDENKDVWQALADR